MDEGAMFYEAYLNGDKDKIDSIVFAYRKSLEFYLYSLCGDRELAENVTQDTFFKLFTKRPKFKPKTKNGETTSFKTWLYTIARNRMYTELKRKTKELPLFDDSVQSSYVNSYTAQPYEIAEAEERDRMIYEAMAKLKREYREVLHLTYFVGLSGKETAQMLGKKPENTQMLLSRARTALKKQLMKDGFDYED